MSDIDSKNLTTKFSELCISLSAAPDSELLAKWEPHNLYYFGISFAQIPRVALETSGGEGVRLRAHNKTPMCRHCLQGVHCNNDIAIRKHLSVLYMQYSFVCGRHLA